MIRLHFPLILLVGVLCYAAPVTGVIVAAVAVSTWSLRRRADRGRP